MSIVLKISTEDDRVSLADQLDQEVAMVRTPGTVAPQKGNSCLHKQTIRNWMEGEGGYHCPYM